MVIPEIPSPVDVETEPRYATVHQGFDIGLRRLGFSNDVAGPDGCEERAYLLQADQSGIRSTEAKAVWAEGSVIGLDGEDVPGQIAFVRVSIREGASATVFLIGPEHHTDGTARPEPKPAHQADGFPGSNGAATVIHGTLTNVPGIDVSAEHHDFIGPLSPAQLGNDIAGGSIGQSAGFHPELEHHRLTPILHAVQHRSIFDAECRRWNPGCGRVVLHHSRMGTVNG